MSRKLLSLIVSATTLSGPALADGPNVAVDIAPVHSLVARVMDGVGEPSLIVAQGASPHEYSLRPSEARALQDADLVFWVSSDLTPWLEDAVATLAADAVLTGLLASEGTRELMIREGALFEVHDHGEHDHEESHGDHSAAHSDHDEVEHHDHGAAQDPHAWLSPDNAAVWLNTIAAALSEADPDNAEAYQANAVAGREELGELRVEIEGILAPVRGRNFIVFHDAYQYFEQAFAFPASGAISLSDATDPSPARIDDIQTRVSEQGVTCVLSEPQFAPGIVDAVMGGSGARTGVLDPLGSELEPGPALYPQLLRGLAKALAECL